jgi:branched-chain amino acid transport system permease protein
MRKPSNLLSGPQTLGRGRAFWSAAAAILAIALVYPVFVDSYDVGSSAYFLCWVFMALGLCLMWGYNGMMSFGQTFFFGLGGYGYGVIEINLGVAHGGAMASLVGAMAVTAVAAALLGYFMIYGRIGGMFFGIVTFAVTLALAFFLNQTAGPEWHIGPARLNGFNGMQGMDPLALPWFGGDIDLEGTAFYYFVLALLVVTYLLLRMLVNSRFGNVLVAIREDPLRAELLGYDVRRYSLVTFVIGSVLGGLSGALYCSWGQFISPSSIGLPAAAMPVVWVAFSGRSDVTATLIGTVLLISGFQALTIYSEQWALVLMGALLAGTVLIAPDGLIVSAANVLARRRARSRSVLTPSLSER